MFIKKFDFGKGSCADGYIKVSETTGYCDKIGYGFIYDKNSDGTPMMHVLSGAVSNESLTGDFCYGDTSDIPLRFDVKVPHMGTYDVKIRINGAATVTILSEWRRFMLTNKTIPQGDCLEYTFTVNICDVHRKDEERFIDRILNIAILGKNANMCTLEIRETDAPTIYIAGDSTVTDQSAAYPYHPKSTYCGWGQQLGQFLKQGTAISNHAQSGLTTQTFMGIHWTVVKERLKKGDYLFMGFGHNDQKVEELGAFTGYYENLKYYIDYAKSVGARPVLCTPINRIIFEEDGSLRDLLGEYGLAVRTLAKEEEIPCIDLLAKTTEYFTAQGSERAWDYFWSDGVNRDYTHTNDLGGNIIARFVAQGIIENKIEPLCRFVKTEEIAVPMPEHIHSTACTAAQIQGIKPVADIGLVNIPKYNDIQGLENEDKIKELSSKGILDGINTFHPDILLSVQSALYWAVRSAGIKSNTTPKGFCSITESPAPVTREQLASIMIASYNYRAPDRAIVGNIDCYADRADIGKEYLDDVRAANELGIIRGITETMYYPKNTITRKDAAELFYKLLHTK